MKDSGRIDLMSTLVSRTDVTIQHVRQLMERQVDAVIGDAVLGIVVGPDFR